VREGRKKKRFLHAPKILLREHYGYEIFVAIQRGIWQKVIRKSLSGIACAVTRASYEVAIAATITTIIRLSRFLHSHEYPCSTIRDKSLHSFNKYTTL